MASFHYWVLSLTLTLLLCRIPRNTFKFHFQDKIVPSLLYNMDAEPSPRGTTNMRDTPELSGPEKETPSQLGETILRELVSSASGSSVKAVLAPVLRHCDNHSLWEEKWQLVRFSNKLNIKQNRSRIHFVRKLYLFAFLDWNRWWLLLSYLVEISFVAFRVDVEFRL